MSPGELIEPGYNTEASDRNIAQEVRNVNDENDHATTRKSPMEPAGTNPSTELHHLGDSRVDSVTNNATGRNTLYEGNISLKNISPRKEGEIKNLSQQREEISRASDGGANVVPSSTNSDSYVGGAPVSAGRSSDGANIAQEAQNVNDEDDHVITRKSPPMEPAGTSPYALKK